MKDLFLEEHYISAPIYGRIATIRLRRDGILHIDIAPDELINLEDIHELINASRLLGKGKKLYNLLTIGANTTADDEARKYASTSEAIQNRFADAFVIHTLPQKIVGNFYLKVNNPLCPTKFFTDKTEALNWLYKIKSEKEN